MKLTPVEILKHLGLCVPEGGIEISTDDALFHVSALELLGRTMSVELISDESLHMRHAGLITSRPDMADLSAGNSAEGAEKSRATLRAVLKSIYGFPHRKSEP